MESKHTLAEQLAELGGARALATAVYCDDRATDAQRAAARQLLLDIRRCRQQLRGEAIRQLTDALNGGRA